MSGHVKTYITQLVDHAVNAAVTKVTAYAATVTALVTPKNKYPDVLNDFGFIISISDWIKISGFIWVLMLIVSTAVKWFMSLYNRFRKADLGHCPECMAPGVAKEDSIEGDTICENGHKYPSMLFTK